jgi:hypothetical protein
MHGKQFKNTYKTAGCIINSDNYQGSGKHWMALFVDTRSSPMTVEFFNSSGNYPVKQWSDWMHKTKDDLAPKGKVKIVNVAGLQHQRSKTECGVYSLYYIWSRLNGISPEAFQKIKVDDELMFEFRQHLFSDPEFNQKYAKIVKNDKEFLSIIEWCLGKQELKWLKSIIESRYNSIQNFDFLNDRPILTALLMYLRKIKDPKVEKFTKFNMDYYSKLTPIIWEE